MAWTPESVRPAISTRVGLLKSTVTAELSTLKSKALLGPIEEDGTLIVDQAAAEEAQAKTDSGVATFLSCSDYDKTLGKPLAVNKSFALNKTFGGAEATGTLVADGNLTGTLEGKAVVRVKKKLCAPYAVDFKYAQVTGNAVLKANGKVDTSLTKDFRFDQKVAQPFLGSISAMAGPIPIYIRFSAPLHLGLEGTAKADVKFDGRATATGSFDVKCTKSGCTGSKTADVSWAQGAAPVVGIDTRADIIPYAYAGIHATAYTDWVGYGEVGLKAKLKGEAWAYYGNTCGDANGDGVNEWVHAAMLEARGGVDLVGKAGFVGRDYGPWTYPLADKHLATFDLLPGGSTAASPIVSVVTPVYGSTRVDATIKMRPCWPWDDAMRYRVSWNDGSATEDTAATHPDQLASRSHTYASYGTKTVTATPIVDARGRGPGRPGSDTINLQPVIFQPITVTGVLAR